MSTIRHQDAGPYLEFQNSHSGLLKQRYGARCKKNPLAYRERVCEWDNRQLQAFR